jgi:SAM-dependent methyltransferase
MNDWTSGYVADIGYIYGYYTELNPLRIRLAFLSAGFAPPDCATACELGFGQGVSVNVHAAASDVRWFGTDFNPAQASLARSLAVASGADARLYDQSFAEFCRRDDLPDFDFIGLHGIWSWISDENRGVIVDFVRRKLAVGGVLYISYNTPPGWSSMVPLRELLTQHAEIMGAPGKGIVGRIDEAIAFADKVLATNPTYARANPMTAKLMEKLKADNRRYIAHEYFNRDWLPMSVLRMADWLAPAKVAFACSAHYLDHNEGLNLSAEQRTLLKDVPDPMFRESVRDFIINQRFRRDYWVRGARRLAPLEQLEGLRATQVMLVHARADVSLKVTASAGEATLQESIYGPILDALADHRPRTLGQIEQAIKGRRIAFPQMVQAVTVLIGAGNVVPVQDESVASMARPRADKLNAYICDKARGAGDVTYLASPLSGGAISLSRVQQLFLLASKEGRSTPAEWASFAWQALSVQGQKILKDGKPLESPGENIAELTSQARAFGEKQLPILKSMQIA